MVFLYRYLDLSMGRSKEYMYNEACFSYGMFGVDLIWVWLGCPNYLNK